MKSASMDTAMIGLMALRVDLKAGCLAYAMVAVRAGTRLQMVFEMGLQGFEMGFLTEAGSALQSVLSAGTGVLAHLYSILIQRKQILSWKDWKHLGIFRGHYNFQSR